MVMCMFRFWLNHLQSDDDWPILKCFISKIFLNKKKKN